MTTPRRLGRFLLSLAVILGLTSSALVTAPMADAATPLKNYTVTRTFGPYNGEATWMNGLPGQVPDGEARVVYCQPGESIVRGSATINRRTSHGVTPREVLTLDVLGAFWNTEVDMLQWGAFINATGRKGWNSVTFTIVCRRH